MTIYGRFGQEVSIKRIGTIDDVRALDGRAPDKDDYLAIEAGSYVVVDDGGRERLYHQCYLRADGGAREIAYAISALEQKKDVTFDEGGRR